MILIIDASDSTHGPTTMLHPTLFFVPFVLPLSHTPFFLFFSTQVPRYLKHFLGCHVTFHVDWHPDRMNSLSLNEDDFTKVY